MKRAILTMMFLVLGAVALAAPVRSMLGAQGAINKTDTSEGWKNPYITDGLVAMWDGEWNVGPGKHDSTSTEWIDLIGGKTFSWSDNEAIFSNNHLLLVNGNKSNKTLSRIYLPISNTTNMTFECVLDFEWKFSDSYANLQYPYLYNGVTLPFSSGKAIGMRTQFYRTTYRFSNGLFADNNTTSCSFTGAVITAPSSAFFNGQQCVFPSVVSSTNTQTPNGYFYLNRTARTDVRHYCIRIYNKQLSLDEVMHNYLVDKERFGLP